MKIFITLFIFTSLSCISSSAQSVPNYIPYRTMTPHELLVYRQSIWDTLPAAVGWVNDFEDLFTPPQEHYLEKILEHFKKATTIEISIVTIDSNMVTEDKFDEFSYRIMKIWGIGKITKSNGIVICICRDYRRICVTTDFGIDKYMNERDKDRMIDRDFSVCPPFTLGFLLLDHCRPVQPVSV